MTCDRQWPVYHAGCLPLSCMMCVSPNIVLVHLQQLILVGIVYLILSTGYVCVSVCISVLVSVCVYVRLNLKIV